MRLSAWALVGWLAWRMVWSSMPLPAGRRHPLHCQSVSWLPWRRCLPVARISQAGRRPRCRGPVSQAVYRHRVKGWVVAATAQSALLRSPPWVRLRLLLALESESLSGFRSSEPRVRMYWTQMFRNPPTLRWMLLQSQFALKSPPLELSASDLPTLDLLRPARWPFERCPQGGGPVWLPPPEPQRILHWRCYLQNRIVHW